MLSVLVTTQHRGVFACQFPEGTDLTERTLQGAKNVRMIIRWRSGKGLPYLAAKGLTNNCQASQVVESYPVIHDVTSVLHIEPEAQQSIWGNG
ncbi:MAG: hypothetical protein AAF741_18830 [Bacteroidota bacterium]